MAKKKEIIEDEKLEDETQEVEEVEEVVTSSEDEEEEYVELTTEERIVNIEKKVNLVLILVAIVVALSLITMIIVINNGSSSKQETTEATQEQQKATNSYDTSAFKEIKAQDIASESKKETIVVMIGRQGCGYCAQYAPIIQSVGEAYGVTIRYIDFLKMVSLSGNSAKIIDQEAYDTIKNLKGATEDMKDAGVTALEGTPATLIIKNNKVVSYIRGYSDANTVAQAFEQAGLGK